jgi:hypothetical protein
VLFTDKRRERERERERERDFSVLTKEEYGRVQR